MTTLYLASSHDQAITKDAAADRGERMTVEDFLIWRRLTDGFSSFSYSANRMKDYAFDDAWGDYLDPPT